MHQPYHSIWISCTNYSVRVLFSCKWCHGIRELCTKNGINHFGHIWQVSWFVAFTSALQIKVEIYQDMKSSHLTFCIILKLKHPFSSPLLTTQMSNNSHSITYHENVWSPIRTFPIIALDGHWVIFHMLELYSTNQIPFYPIRLCSITSHFLVNNLHFIIYSNHIFKPR